MKNSLFYYFYFVFDSYFSLLHQLLLCITFLFILIGFINQKWTEIWWFLAILVLKYFYLTLHDVLFLWDEQFHALVAKNMTDNLLLPKLYTDSPLNIPLDEHWTGQSIWLHKQPFFLWLMAFSIKIFGATPLAVKLPSVVFSFASVFFLYKGLMNVLSNRWIVNLTCLSFGINSLLNDTMIGFEATDHNDSIFVSLIIFSFWSFTEYLKNNSNKKFIILTGVFSGFAMLTKWLVGLYIFGLWVFYLFFTYIKNKNKLDFYIQAKNIFISLTVAFFIFVPWQVYSYLKYPHYYVKELNLNVFHFSEVLEKHEGNFNYYFEIILNYILNGEFVFIFPFLMGLITLRYYIKNYSFYIAWIFISFFVLIFFSIAKTKMKNFTSLNFPFYYAVFFSVFAYLYENNKNKFNHAFMISLVLIYLYLSVNPENIQFRHTKWNKNSEFAHRIHNAEFAKSVSLNILNAGYNNKTVFFNFMNFNHISFMFYTGYTAYSFIPDEKNIQRLKEKNMQAVVLDYNGALDTLRKSLDVKILRVNIPDFN